MITVRIYWRGYVIACEEGGDYASRAVHLEDIELAEGKGFCPIYRALALATADVMYRPAAREAGAFIRAHLRRRFGNFVVGEK